MQRLSLAVRLLESTHRRRLCCAGCRTPVAPKASVFSVPGAGGAVGAYVNPHGVVHQTVTLRTAANLLLQGRAVAEDSWFPGAVDRCRHASYLVLVTTKLLLLVNRGPLVKAG